MPVYKIDYDYSPELHERIIADISQPMEKLCAEKILSIFHNAGFTIKVKHLFPDTPNSYYRILCFIKKSAEAVIINTRTDLEKESVINSMTVQIRIVNKSTFDMLEQFTDGIRTQIVDANNCRFCSEKCNGKRYEFVYAGTQHTKCHYLCSNFRFTVHDENEINDIISIIKNELEYKKIKLKQPVR